MPKTMTITEAINYTKKMARGVSYKKPLTVCVNIMNSGVRECFDQQTGPDGQAWKPLSGATKRMRRGGGAAAKILQDTGRLKASIANRVTNRDAITGTNLRYAAIQNFGGKIKVTPKMRAFLHWRGVHLRGRTKFITIPARPFIGHKDKNLVKYEKVFADFEEKRARTTNG